MELKEAIEILKGLIEPQSTLLGSFDKEAIKTVLGEVENKDEWYTKGYEDGDATEKIEELDVDSFYDEIKGYETLDFESAVLGITDKINEVIRRINNVR